MYLRQALIECRKLELGVACFYEDLVALCGRTEESAACCAQLARDARAHAATLQGLLALQDDDGPLVVGLRTRIVSLTRLLEHAHRKLVTGVTPQQAAELAESIEAAEVNEVFGYAIELAGCALEEHPELVEVHALPGKEHYRAFKRFKERMTMTEQQLRALG